MSDRDPVRLFLALWPGERVRVRLAACRDAWRWPRGAKPVADETLHLTLHFIGAFARARVAELATALADVPVAPMSLRPGRAEVWRGGVAVLKIDGDPALAELHARLGDVVTSAGVALDARPFAPHVTLARRAARADPPPRSPAFRWRASGFVLVESIPGGAARYEVLDRFGAAPPARSDSDSG
ncbi:MAG TPA: RNA 2',3'-cyclic phosphodiesterase [Caldimonas sp.]|nr:RNA 2',3'-cyclic phosphodiesterase [Caldimonas sp.]